MHRGMGMAKIGLAAVAMLAAQGCALLQVLEDVSTVTSGSSGTNVPAIIEGGTPLHDAALAGNLAEVKRLLAAGADINARDKRGWSAVDAALFMDHTEVAQYLMGQGGTSSPNAADADGDTWLIGATVDGDRGMALALLERGADPNHRNNLGRTALMYAAIEMQDDIARALLEKNADPNIGEKDGDTALHFAVYRQAKGLNIVRMLLDSKANPNAADNLGDTPMHWAAAAGNVEAARLLIAHGGNVNARSKAGQTPLGRANAKSQKAFANFLRAQGAKE